MPALAAFLALAAKALLRRKLRTALAMGGVALAVAVALGVAGFGIGYRDALGRDLDKLGYEVVVTAKGCPYEAATMIMRGGNIPMYLESDLAQRVVDDPEVRAHTRMLMQTAPPGDRPQEVLHLGVDAGYVQLKPWLTIRRGAWFTTLDADEAVLGANAADLLHLEVGVTVELGRRGELRRPFRVVGVLDFSGSQDDGTIFLPLKSAQFLFDRKDQVTGVGVKLKDPEHTADFVERMYRLPSTQVVTMSHVRTALLDLVAQARALIAGVTVVAALVALFGVMNTILFSVLERTAVLGVMKALGASGRDLLTIVVLETVLVCTGGGLLGIALTFAGSSLVEAVLRRVLAFTPRGDLLALPPALVGGALAACVGAGVVAGLYPGLRAALIDPVRSMRNDG